MSDETVTGAHARISGQVQGVWFRQSTADRARELGLSGWVRNLPDGRVEVWAQGPRHAVEELIAFVSVGPPLAKVLNVETQWAEPRDDAPDFEVR